MNILLESRSFYPSVGGLETSSDLLATQWQKTGHNVRVMTQTPIGAAAEKGTLNVVRRPDYLRQFQLMHWCDAFVQSGISLRSLPVALLAGCPVVVAHRDFVQSTEPGWPGLPRVLKQMAARFLVKNVAVSNAVAAVGLPTSSTTVIHNAFRPVFYDETVRSSSAEERSGLLFVGRLVTEKGCDLAIEALARLHARGIDAQLKICGDGPEKAKLEQQVCRHGLKKYIKFAGVKKPVDLANEYKKAEVVVMPSRNEPFGNVAIEALACGTPVVAAEVGGLPEAVGECGFLFPSGDVEAMTACIAEAKETDTRMRLLKNAETHLAKHRIVHVAQRYIEVIESVVPVI